MSISICYFDVATGKGRFKENGIYVIHGEGSQLDYARFIGNAVIRGAKAIAVAHGLDVTQEGGKAVIVYATKEFIKERGFTDWIQGKTLDECFPNECEKGRAVNVVNVEGRDYLRDDKNCIASDKVGAIQLGDSDLKDGWYTVDGKYCGPDVPEGDDS